MRIEVIDSRPALTALRASWDEVYAADPEANFFLSWTWIANWLDTASSRWFVLAARPAAGAPPVAFLPLRVWLSKNKDGTQRREIAMAGNKLADYTGFLCRPEHADDALAGFADHLKTLDWSELNLENIRASPERFGRFLARFGEGRFTSAEVDHVDPVAGTDNMLCPYAELPEDWDGYLATRLSANTRQKIRRFLRMLEGSQTLRITHAGADTIDRDIDVLLRFWDVKWRPRKGARTDSIVATNRTMLRRCFEAGALLLPILWDGERPLGALASFVDPPRRALLFYMGARDETVETPPPGLVLHAHSIRHAIGAGLRTYDFLRGNEPYKYSYGVAEMRIRHVVLSRRSLAASLDSAALARLFATATAHHRDGALVEAEQGYREVLVSHPRHLGALYGLGQLLATRGDHGAAEQLLSTFVSLNPQSARGWLRLAGSLQARDKLAAAAEAYREAIARQPERFEAHHGLGHVLVRLGRREEAIAALQQAVAIRPDHAEAQASLGNLLDAAGRLTRATRRPYARVNLQLADQRRAAGALDAAVALYRRAIALDDALAAAHHGLGLALQAKGELRLATSAYRRVLRLEPGHREARGLIALLTLAPTRGADARNARAAAAAQFASAPDAQAQS